MLLLEVILNPCDEVVLKGTLDYLMKEVTRE